jgi:hypothetical protein
MDSPRHIFVSRPTRVDSAFEAAYAIFHQFLEVEGLRPRRLGQSDYSRKAPLQAVIEIIDNCCGAIVLGYPQLQFLHEVRRSSEVQSKVGHVFPTPWNQIEGALAYRAKAPVLVVAHTGVGGGVFDHGVTGEGVLHIDLAAPYWHDEPAFRQPFYEWKTDIEECLRRSGGP